MFTKYVGKLGDYEAECVQEILDLAGGDVREGQAMVADALLQLQRNYEQVAAAENALDHNRSLLVRLHLRRKLPVPEVVSPITPFVQAVAAIAFASPRWWWDGIEKLGLKHVYDMQKRAA